MREVELKFEVSPDDAARLRRADALRGTRPKRTRMRAIYFDTPDHRLAAHGMALRVRREGRRWVQCLKAGRTGDGGLHARDEWEAPRPDASLDTALLQDTPLGPLIGRGKPKLAPVFEVEMERVSWQLELGGGNRVEVALDRGEVRRGRKRSPVCELEVESVAGDPLAVFDAAERLLGEVPLHASTVTKAQRGYALARTTRPAPVKAIPLDLAREASVDEAARRVVAAALAQLQANQIEAAREGREEYLHQFRVGLRRLRSTLRVFREAFPKGEAARIRADCRWLSRATGAARDWDVFVGGMLRTVLEGSGCAPVRRGIRARAEAKHAAARKRAREALDSPRYTRFVLRFARWLASPHGGMGGEVAPFAARTLRRQHRKSVRKLHRVGAMDAGERHRMRIRLKRLRYACEALAPVFGAESPRRYVRTLARLQEDLGDAADARTAMRLARGLGCGAPATRSACARLEALEAESLRRVGKHVGRLRDAVPFWGANGA